MNTQQIEFGLDSFGEVSAGFPPPSSRQYEREIAEGALFVGSPTTVAAKIAASIRTLGLSRFDLKYDIGRLPREQRAASIELYGREVIPRISELLQDPPVAPTAADQRVAAATNAGPDVQQ